MSFPAPFTLPRTAPGALLAALLSSLSLAIGAAPASELPDLGDAAETVLSRPAEQQLGAQSMREVRSGGGYLDDPEVNAYLDGLGQRLVAAAPVFGQSFEFFAVPSAEINAFAMPGGYIGVNSGLIIAAEDESQLASVLAHEISHVTQHHLARLMASQSGGQYGMLAALGAALLASRAGGGQAVNGVLTTAMAAQAQSQINYTREHEEEADRIGFQRLADAGFDPQAMAGFFERMQQLTRSSESATPAYLRSHPLTTRRIAEARDRALDAPYRQVADSLEFHFVRALLRSYEGEPREAVARLGAEVAAGRGRDPAAGRYGYAAALLRAGDFSSARRELEALEANAVHPMIEALAGQILQQSGDTAAAVRRYEAALKRYPNYLQLVRDYPRALLKDGQPAAAAGFAEAQLAARRGDGPLHQIAAEADAALGRRMLSHYHQGEYYAALGDAGGAAEQFELALRSGDGGERELNVAEMRLREVRAAARLESGAAGRPGAAAQGFGSSASLPGFTRP